MHPKYKKILERWNKKTGEGDVTPVNAIDHDAEDCWLVYLFCMDLETTFLLVGNADG